MRKADRLGTASRPDSDVNVEDLHASGGVHKPSSYRSRSAFVMKAARSVHFESHMSESGPTSSISSVMTMETSASLSKSKRSSTKTKTSSSTKGHRHTRTKSISKPRGKPEWHALLLDSSSSTDPRPRLLEVTTNLNPRQSPPHYQTDPYAEPLEFINPTSGVFDLDDLARALPHPCRPSSDDTSLPPQRPTPQLHSELGLYPLQWSLLHLPEYARSTLPSSDLGINLDLQEILESPASPGVQTILVHVRQMGDVLEQFMSYWGPIGVSKRHLTREITVSEVLEAIQQYFFERLTVNEARGLPRQWKDRVLDSRVARIFEQERQLAAHGLDDMELKHARHVQEWESPPRRMDLLSGCTQFGGLSIWSCAEMGKVLDLNLRLIPDFNVDFD
ncbi:hypothetical protein K435DRAFT_805485 [Dendrothele bispora CBS 962.96]|uniref:DUF6699 domain-containing protein n=1 Tax=Dendrothele bispora (strain CBS 962.96) TaxID=1314807 RepID=A0A4S8LB34_DENBC|nr:hypothetical protein K435DRAFT_805485 [Dendrothele bispora CBS 962.96]